MIELDSLSVTFNQGTPNQVTALRNVDLRLADGELVTVVGSNGAGKTTMLNSIAGVVTPISGRVLINGVDVTAMPVHHS